MRQDCSRDLLVWVRLRNSALIGQGWTLYKIFDSQEEVANSSDEEEFAYSTEMEVDGEGTHAMTPPGSTLIVFASRLSSQRFMDIQ